MLTNVNILDLSRVLAGPFAGMLLADLGANVIKVERPGAGDETRGWGPPFDARGESAYFLSVNRNKLSVAADFSLADDRALVRRLIEGADVVIDNFKRGTLERLGLSPELLMREQPSLIWCTITGFGAESDRPGYDFVVQAESGWMAITGEPHGDPMKAGVALVDVLAGQDAVIGILAALVRRGSSGQGRRVTISLAASAVAALVNVAQSALVTGREPERWGNAHANLVPYQLFLAADRPLVIAVGSDAQWIACAGALGLDALGADPALATNSGRVVDRDRVTAAIAARVAEQPAQVWHERLAAAGVPCGVVRPVREALGDVQGASPLLGVPSSVGGTIRRPPPLLDEHGALIRERGWGAFE